MLKNLSFLLMAVILSPICYGQFGMQNIIDPQANGITAIIPIDVNNDSFIDIAISQKYNSNNKISYYLNLGNEQFGAQEIVASNIPFPLTLAKADINGDGWTDLVSASSNSELFWIPNNSGSFGSKQVIDINFVNPSEVKTVDIDNDGFIDIIAASDVELSIHYNDGEGNFNKEIIPMGSNTEYYAIDIADINGDDFLDIIAGGVATLIYMNNNGSFSLDSERSLSANSVGLVFLVHAKDLDNDGDIDLILDGSSSNQIQCYKNDGDGYYSLSQVIDDVSQCSSVATSDFDLDGDLDLLVPHHQTGKIMWYENNGNADFSSGQLIHQGSIPFTTRVLAADLNNDGAEEAIWSEELSFHINSVVLDLKDIKDDPIFSIYPNPGHSPLKINTSEKGIIVIYSIDGSLIKKDIIVDKGENIIHLNLETGSYILVINTISGYYSEKLIID